MGADVVAAQDAAVIRRLEEALERARRRGDRWAIGNLESQIRRYRAAAAAR